MTVLRSPDAAASRQEGGTSQFLSPSQIAMIDEALCSLGDYGEVRLIVEKGHLRFLVTQRSFDALHWRPGCISSAE